MNSFIKIFVYVITLITLVSCHKTTVYYPNGYDFEECYIDANQYMINEYGEDNFRFYEAIATMSHNVDDSCFIDSSYVVELKVIFQLVNDSSVIEVIYPQGNYHKDSIQVKKVNGLWLDDAPLDITKIQITLDSMKILYGIQEIAKPFGNTIVMRHPDLDGFDSFPYFLFGNDSTFVCLDKNGKLVKY